MVIRLAEVYPVCTVHCPDRRDATLQMIAAFPKNAVANNKVIDRSMWVILGKGRL
jgi:hypothetical protein